MTSDLLEENQDLRKQVEELENAYNETEELLTKQIEITYKLDKENTELKEFINAPHTKGRSTTRGDYIKTVWDLSKKLSLKFNPNKMIEFGAYVLYYSANPESKMDIPNCVYEKVEKMYAAWNKRCENCIHGEEHKKAIQEGKQGSAFCMLECNASHSCFEPKE